MIVLPSPPGLIIIRQTDHAALSGQAAAAWQRPDGIPEAMWPRFVDAAWHHDDGWTEADRLPVLDSEGRPFGFADIPTPLHTALWTRGVENLSEQDDYAAILVAQHGKWLYETFPRSGGPEDTVIASEFIARMARLVDQRAEALSRGSPAERLAVEPPALLAARRLLSFLDALSLMLLGGIPKSSRTEELPLGGRAARLSLSWSESGATIAPWPFGNGSVPVSSPRRLLGRDRFASPSECAAAIAHAVPAPFTGVLRKGPISS